MNRLGVSLGVAAILLLLLYLSATLLFNRTNPARELRWIPVREYAPFLLDALGAMGISWRGRW